MKKLFVSTVIALLLLTVLASIVYAAPIPVPFKGALQGAETYQVAPPTLYVNGNAAGDATELGQFTATYAVVVDLTTGEGPASIHLVAANGDSIFAEGPGQGTATTTPNVHQIVERYTITGGTGRFAGASGDFTVERLVNLITGATSGTFDGNIVMAVP